jgi:hypothetical protein
MSAFEAFAAAKAAGVRIALESDGRILVETKTPPLPADVVALLRAVKPDLMRVLEWREAAWETASSPPPRDCGDVWVPSGVRRTDKRTVLTGDFQNEWPIAMDGLNRFVLDGWGDQACLMGWSKRQLYARPWKWSQIHLTGAALLIGEQRVLAVTADNIVIKARSGSTLKFRRIGREHLA